MSVVAVKRKGKKIEMSCDEQVSYGHNKYSIKKNHKTEAEDQGKIFKTNGMLIGGVGSLSELNLFKLFCKNHKPQKADIDSILEMMLEFRAWFGKKTGDEDYVLYNDYFIVVEDKIFQVNEGFHITEKDDYWAIGSGMFSALAALHFGKSTIEAVEVAKVYDLYCSGETYTITN